MKIISKVKKLTALLLASGMIGGLWPFYAPKITADDVDTPTPLVPNVFAMKDELTCSWGTATPNPSSGHVDASTDALQQKLYFGTNVTDVPLEWWICGRLKEDGSTWDIAVTESDITCSNAAVLYLAKSVYLDANIGATLFNQNNYGNGFDILDNYTRTGENAGDEGDTNFLKANGTCANFWGLSDIRARLNRGLGTPGVEPGEDAGSKNGLINTTGTALITPSEFEAKYLRAGEMPLVLPSTVQIYDRAEKNGESPDYIYTTIDRFYLPSGNWGLDNGGTGRDSWIYDELLCWNGADLSNISGQGDLASATTAYADFIVPFSYWSDDSISNTLCSWLRSPYPDSNNHALCALRGSNVTHDYVNDPNLAVAPACKINLASVIFASAARSAALPDAEGAGFSEISGNPGMYLRFDATDFSETIAEPEVYHDPLRAYETEEPGLLNTITAGEGETITIQGVISGGPDLNWSYSKPGTTSVVTELTIAEIVQDAGANGDVKSYLLSEGFANVKIWAEKLGAEETNAEGLLLASEPAWGRDLHLFWHSHAASSYTTAPTTDPSDAAKTIFHVYSAAEFALFANDYKAANGALDGCQVNIEADLDLSDYYWMPMVLRGVEINGKGNTISNLKLSNKMVKFTPSIPGRNTVDTIGLIGGISKGYIHDLCFYRGTFNLGTLEDPVDGAIGVLCGYNDTSEICNIAMTEVGATEGNVTFGDADIGLVCGVCAQACEIDPFSTDPVAWVTGVTLIGCALSAGNFYKEDKDEVTPSNIGLICGGNYTGIISGCEVKKDCKMHVYSNTDAGKPKVRLGGVCGLTSTTETEQMVQVKYAPSPPLLPPLPTPDPPGCVLNNLCRCRVMGPTGEEDVVQGGICGLVVNDTAVNNVYIKDSTEAGGTVTECFGSVIDGEKKFVTTPNYFYANISALKAAGTYDTIISDSPEGGVFKATNSFFTPEMFTTEEEHTRESIRALSLARIWNPEVDEIGLQGYHLGFPPVVVRQGAALNSLGLDSFMPPALDLKAATITWEVSTNGVSGWATLDMDQPVTMDLSGKYMRCTIENAYPETGIGNSQSKPVLITVNEIINNNDDDNSYDGDDSSNSGEEDSFSTDDTAAPRMTSPITQATSSVAQPQASPATATTATAASLGVPAAYETATAPADEQVRSDDEEISDDTVGSTQPAKKTDSQPNWFVNNWAWLLAATVLVAGGGTIAYIKRRKNEWHG